MLKLARARLPERGSVIQRIEFVHADALNWRPAAEPYDWIVTHFFLDCLREEQLRQLIEKLAQAAEPRSNRLLADCCLPPSGLGRVRARIIHRLMYAFFGIVTKLPASHLTAPDRFLEDQGFLLRERRFAEWGLLHSDCWERAVE